MQIINHSQLKKMIDGNEDFKLINVLPVDDFLKEHIPQSENIPIEKDGFEMMVEKKLGSKDKTVVVYSKDSDCQASLEAARRLDEMGFGNVYYFSDGIKGWEDRGYPVEGPQGNLLQ